MNWLPDCFGFSPAFPQLLRLAGLDSFFTHKTNWSERNKLPSDLFWWEGLDGSRVLMHTYDNPAGGYNAWIGPRAAVETWRNYQDKESNPESLLLFGWGDGGGGPTENMLQRIRQLADFPAMPALRYVNVAEWFADITKRAGESVNLPVWVGEIYLEYHRGTLTTQGRTKYLHRRAERALITAETLASMAALLGAPIAASLEEHWRVLLRNQFHDIIPGSSIREVYELAEKELADVVAAGTAAQQTHLDAIAKRVGKSGSKRALLVVNPDLSPRPLRIASSETLPGGQAVEGGSVIAADRTVPGLSAAVVIEASLEPAAGLAVGADFLENRFVRVELSPDGTLKSVFDKRAGRECLAGRGNQIRAYVDKPRLFDAWDIEEDYTAQSEEIVASGPPEIVERGPHRAAIRIARKFRDSSITQTIRLWANSPRIEFKTDIDWHDRRILLKANFPLAIRAETAIFECAHGVIRRPTHRNTPWDQAKFEVAAHRFVDLAEHGFGVALLNDGKYGHHALGNEIGISLLRSPVNPDALADEGFQSFTYALLPHSGDWLTGGVLAEAEDLNQPLLCKIVDAADEATWSAVNIEGVALGLSGLKPAEEGSDLILRTYEPAGARGAAKVTLPAGWEIVEEVNLLEEVSRAGQSELHAVPAAQLADQAPLRIRASAARPSRLRFAKRLRMRGLLDGTLNLLMLRCEPQGEPRSTHHGVRVASNASSARTEPRLIDGLQFFRRNAADALHQKMRQRLAGKQQILVERIDRRRDVVENVGRAFGDDVDIAADDKPGILQPGHKADRGCLDAADNSIGNRPILDQPAGRVTEFCRIVVEVKAGDENALNASFSHAVLKTVEKMVGAGQMRGRGNHRKTPPALPHKPLHRLFRHRVVVEVEIGVLLLERGPAVGDERHLAIEQIARALVLRRRVREDQAIDLRVLDEVADRLRRDRRRRCAAARQGCTAVSS